MRADVDTPFGTSLGDVEDEEPSSSDARWWEENGRTGDANDDAQSRVSSYRSFTSSPGWPYEVSEDALRGLAGDVARTLEPHSEADPIAILGQTLAAFGSLIGRGAHVRVEADEHPGRLYLALVGDTSRGRKGTSWGHVRRLFESVDESFSERVASGLSSGEGLIDHVRDDEEEPRDKRLLVVETELASTLKVIERQGNTLSPVLRSAWDGTTLRTLTRNSPLKSTNSHISIIGHITLEELRRRLDETEAANGFGNRFLWLCVRRSKLLPDGGSPPQNELNAIAIKLNSCFRNALRAGTLTRDEGARSLWRSVYGDLSNGAGGLTGSLTSRAEAQVTRLSLLYALLDEADAIGEEHLRAALALWDYAERSVAHVFGDSTGNPNADVILRALRETPEGLTRTDISNLFGRNLSAARIDQALTLLLEQRRAHFTKEETGGRPSQRWHYGSTNQTSNTNEVVKESP